MPQNEYQVSFFDYLYDRGGYKRTDQFAEEVANALYISRSGAYKKIRAISKWAKNILAHSETMDRFRDDYKVYSFSDEVPVFHLLPFHHLLSFKLFVWNRSNWNIQQYGATYDFSYFDRDAELKSTVAEINDHFISYESIDIWGRDFLTATLNQLRYYTKLGAFTRPEDPMLILADIRKMINHLRATAKAGAKMRYGYYR